MEGQEAQIKIICGSSLGLEKLRLPHGSCGSSSLSGSHLAPLTGDGLVYESLRVRGEPQQELSTPHPLVCSCGQGIDLCLELHTSIRSDSNAR